MLKSHFKLAHDDINFRCKNVAEAGLLVIYSTTPVGFVEKPTNPSGRDVAGLLLTHVANRAVPSNLPGGGASGNFVGEDTGTVTFPRNFSKNETHVSGMVRLLKIGEIETNNLDASDTFAPGDDLYITTNGLISNVQDNAGAERVGHSLGVEDADGYLKVYINIV